MAHNPDSVTSFSPLSDPKKAPYRKAVNEFCITRLRQKLPCYECPANGEKICESAEWWCDKTSKTIKQTCLRIFGENF